MILLDKLESPLSPSTTKPTIRYSTWGTTSQLLFPFILLSGPQIHLETKMVEASLRCQRGFKTLLEKDSKPNRQVVPPVFLSTGTLLVAGQRRGVWFQSPYVTLWLLQRWPPVAPNLQDTIHSGSELTKPLDARPTHNKPICHHFHHQRNPVNSHPCCSR